MHRSKKLFAAGVVTSVLVGCASTPSVKLPDSVSVTPFKSVKTSVEHSWNKDTSYPFTGGAAIDVNGDGTMEIFISGGHNQGDSLLSYRDGEMVNVIASTGLSHDTASYGATAVDLDGDGQTDLIVARDDGVWLHMNNNGSFTSSQLAYTPGNTESALTVAVADIDLDGDIDLYLSNFIAYADWKSSTFNDPNHIRYNKLLRNDGNFKFTDITAGSGVAGTQNTFLSVFTDLNTDGYQDLILSNNTGKLEILINDRDNTFTKNAFDSGIGYWMGLGVGDFDNDGDQDFAASNVSNSIPTGIVRGDLNSDQELYQEWIMVRNDGDGVFTEIAESSGLTGHGFGWGMVFEDLNLDGNLDLLAAQSYIKWPPHKLSPLSGRAMLQDTSTGTRRFINAPGLRLADRHFGQSPIIADLNGDAKQDVVWVNMDGPVLTSLNQNRNDVVTLAVPESAKWMGARVTANTSTGKSYTREVNNAIGMQTDQSPHLSFAVPEGGSIESLKVTFPTGISTTIAVSGPGLIKP